MKDSITVVGLDVHKNSIEIVTADADGAMEVRRFGIPAFAGMTEKYFLRLFTTSSSFHCSTIPFFRSQGETMTLKMTLKVMVVLGVVFLTAQVSAEETLVLKTQKEKVSYGLGVDVGRNLKRQRIEADVDLVIKGLKDGLSGEKLLIPDDELRIIMGAFQHELTRRQLLALKMVAEENSKKGEAFLAENKAKEGVVTLPSGLQYKILKAGDGKRPTEADTVECHYRGTLINGTELDRSEAGKPVTSMVTAVIPGWREALQLMPVGSKWQLFIPPHLAYGEKGGGGKIGPNATLIFEVELLAIK